jgi:hypothetical protein
MWKQMSDSVLDSKILATLKSSGCSCPDASFCEKKILQPSNVVLKHTKIVADAETRLEQLTLMANPPPDAAAPTILKKPGDATQGRSECRVVFVFDPEPPDPPAAKKKIRPRVRGNRIPVMDYETALIEEIRAEASVARRIHRETKRVRT